MRSLTSKTFSGEKIKKIHWVKCMFTDWRYFRNNSPYLQSVECNLDDDASINVETLNASICKFIMEVKKRDGSDFPGRTLSDIVICIQFWLGI